LESQEYPSSGTLNIERLESLEHPSSGTLNINDWKAWNILHQVRSISMIRKPGISFIRYANGAYPMKDIPGFPIVDIERTR
jgi:hypothetical protein